MKAIRPLCVALMALTGQVSAQDQPLSAIGWLNETSRVPVARPVVPPSPEAPVAQGVTLPEVTVMPLGGTRRDAVGLLPPDVTGLPVSLWIASREADLETLWERTTAEPMPAVQALYYTLLLAEAEPPSGDDGAFLATRVRALMRFGAIEPAHAMLERAGPDTSELFPLWFDLSLLTGDEAKPCEALNKNPALMKSYAAQIFCHARAGDWSTAALLFDSAAPLGLLSKIEAHLLAQYLDPEMVDDSTTLAPPSSPDPLIFSLYEAAGAPLPTRSLPRLFATADLRNTAGWKAEIEAAERLTRTGALTENRLLGLYTDRRPAASGGIWDRVSAVQKFDAALTNGSAEEISATLPSVWAHMGRVGLQVPFAQLYGQSLARRDLTGQTAELAWRIRLLSSAYESAAKTPPEGADRFLAALALGTPTSDLATTQLEQSIAEAFASTGAAHRHEAHLREGKLGEAILRAAILLDRSGPEDYDEIRDALATLRAVGLEDTARRAALQRLILGQSR